MLGRNGVKKSRKGIALVSDATDVLDCECCECRKLGIAPMKALTYRKLRMPRHVKCECEICGLTNKSLLKKRDDRLRLLDVLNRSPIMRTVFEFLWRPPVLDINIIDSNYYRSLLHWALECSQVNAFR